MSATHMIAWGMLEIDASNFQRWRKEVRRELRARRIRLEPLGNGYKLTSKGKKSGHRRRACLGRGSFIECCEKASKLLTPSNPEE